MELSMSTNHQPVLLEQVMQYLDPKEGESYLDLTAGYGGHAEQILARTKAPGNATLVDRDQFAIDHLRSKFAQQPVHLIHQDYLSASRALAEQGQKYDLIMADVGVSSPHLDNASRGFSLKTEGPLDMRMDQNQEVSAATIVNDYDEAALFRILRDYGEEPRARRIAQAIIASRPVTTTTQLAQIVSTIWPEHSRVHPATRTFQALRIAVNGELEQLQNALPIWIDMLAPGGRLAVISFHSLEDRIVKKQLALYGGERYDAPLRLLTRRPVTGSDTEIVSNPRARSAKLRAAVKNKNKERGV